MDDTLVSFCEQATKIAAAEEESTKLTLKFTFGFIIKAVIS
jgi:hypothetical protein